MPWGAAIAAVAAVGSSVASNKASKKASKKQAASAREGMASEERMFDRSLELQEPYREAGYGALEGLQGLTNQDYRAEQLQGYYAGPEYAQMSQQVEQQQLRNAAVTGGVRGGSNQVALASIAPQLGQQYLSGLNQQYTGLANMGMGAASQGSGQAMQLGQSMSGLQQQAGQAAAQNQIAQANIWGNAAQDIGALGYDYFNRG
ncbi:MAG TPA: hypothetical protein EYN67_01135 [Flavobacteriales bacterium]|nr:hypothetical protein [Methylococcaceae bacterium]HHZ94171.1 hypothetical protein [Flavobacteriales bacterium]